MLRFERTTDLDRVRELITHPRIYPFATDDFAPAAAEFRPVDNPFIWYVLAYDDAELLGLFPLYPENGICWQIHCCLLPNAYGPRAIAAASGVFAWIFASTPCRRIVASIPASNRLARRLARRSGMLMYGINAASLLKGGRLQDQILFGISPGETAPCPQQSQV